MPLDTNAKENENRRYNKRNPSALHEFFSDIKDEDRNAEYPSDTVNDDLCFPILMLFSSFDPKAYHSRFGKRESKEHIDRIHEDERRSVATGIDHHPKRRRCHYHHTVLHREPIGKRCETMRQIRICRHVRHDARSVNKPRLRRNEKKRARRDKCDPYKHIADRYSTELKTSCKIFQQYGIHCLSGSRLCMEKEVADHDSRRSDSK